MACESDNLIEFRDRDPVTGEVKESVIHTG